MISFLLSAIAADLRTHLSLDAINCDVMPGPQPKPMCGQIALSIYGGQITNPEPNISVPVLRESYNVMVSVTVRSSPTPIHKSRSRYLDDSTSLHTISTKVKQRLHGSYSTIMADAKTLLDASDVGGYYTGRLAFISQPADPEIKDHSWFYSLDSGQRRDEADTSHGLNSIITFSGVRWTNGT